MNMKDVTLVPLALQTSIFISE